MPSESVGRWRSQSEPLPEGASVSPIEETSKSMEEFYRTRAKEQKEDDKYKKRVDRHLKQLISDRYELENEILKRGEKISELQSALSELQISCFGEKERYLNAVAENEKVKKNNVSLHESIQQLLNMTKEKDLRDRIVYVFKHPHVEIAQRSTVASDPNLRGSSYTLQQRDEMAADLERQVRAIQNQLNDYNRLSKRRSDVLLEDCKASLEKAKGRISRDEKEIKMLQDKLKEKSSDDFLKRKEPLHEVQSQLTNGNSLVHNSNRTLYVAERDTDQDILSTAKGMDSAKYIQNIVISDLKDMRLSLILLSKLLSKITSLLKVIQSTRIFIRMNVVKKSPSECGAEFASESDIMQLELHIRQCTRLSSEISERCHKLDRVHSSRRVQSLENLTQIGILEMPERKELEVLTQELIINTAEADLAILSLSRSGFFDYIKGVRMPFNKHGVKDTNIASRYMPEFLKLGGIMETVGEIVLKEIKLIEKMLNKYSIPECNQEDRSKTPVQINSSSSVIEIDIPPENDAVLKSQVDKANSVDGLTPSLQELGNLIDIYKRTLEEAKAIGVEDDSEIKSVSEKLKKAEKRYKELQNKEKSHEMEETHPKSVALEGGRLFETGSQHIIRDIDKTLAKVRQIETGEYAKDDAYTKLLEQKISLLKDNLKDISTEFSMQNLQDQFSEYSSVTLGKLEALARSSRDSVATAECQIRAHRTNAKFLSDKLRETEELLRESINECLTLKQRMRDQEVKRQIEKESLVTDLKQSLYKSSNFDELQAELNKVVSTTRQPTIPKQSKVDTFMCKYCQQGGGHKACDEQIKELTCEKRKVATELKLLEKELREEKRLSKTVQDELGKTEKELITSKADLKDTLRSLEAKNASLLEQLKLEKKRMKNMERFRRLEIEGFQTDINNLKSKIKDLERQLMKAISIFESDRKDMELLRTVHDTAQRSKHATSAIKRLKAKLYELETDIKYL